MDRYVEANAVLSLFAKNYMELKKGLPVRPSEMAVINIITRRDGDFTPAAIAALLGVSKPMIAAHLKSLEKKGYIFREGAENDRRSFYVRPTGKARALADGTEVGQTRILKEIEGEIGAEAFERLVESLGRVNDVMRKTTLEVK